MLFPCLGNLDALASLTLKHYGEIVETNETIRVAA